MELIVIDENKLKIMLGGKHLGCIDLIFSLCIIKNKITTGADIICTRTCVGASRRNLIHLC